MLRQDGIQAVIEAAGNDTLVGLLDAGYTFPQAIELCAAHYDIPLALELPGRAPEHERAGQRRLLALVESATEFFVNYLWLSPSDTAAAARAYLVARNISQATALAFRLGASPGDNGLSRRFAQQGVPAQHLMLAGLGYDGGGDVFRSRLILPVRRSDGKINGFGGRTMMPDDPAAKYINSPTTLLFDKGHSLYAPPGLREACLAAGYVVLVEGYLDVVAMWQAGFYNVCALMGVAAARGQVTRLSTLAPIAVVALDPDFAGERAAVSAARELVRAGRDVRLAALRGGDPDEILALPHGRDYIVEMLQSAVPFVSPEETAGEA